VHDSDGPAAEVMSRPLHDWGPDLADRGRHTVTAGYSNPNHVIHMDLLGLHAAAAVDSSPGRSKEGDMEESGMDCDGAGTRRWLR
jgi:hypothetical protein